MRAVRTSSHRAVLLTACALAALVATLAAQTAGASPAAGACGAGHLAGKVRQSSGAAGTAAVSIRIRNVSGTACTLRGFPRLKLRGPSGPLPTLVRHGGLAILNRPVATITLSPGKSASLLVTWSNVPTGAETTCPHATSLVVILKNGAGRFTVPFDASPCNSGTLHESPFLSGLQNV